MKTQFDVKSCSCRSPGRAAARAHRDLGDGPETSPGRSNLREATGAMKTLVFGLFVLGFAIPEADAACRAGFIAPAVSARGAQQSTGMVLRSRRDRCFWRAGRRVCY